MQNELSNIVDFKLSDYQLDEL